MADIKTIIFKDEVLNLIDQRKIPQEKVYFQCKTMDDVIFAIKDMVVRGAPAIGSAAAYGFYFGVKENINFNKTDLDHIESLLNESRPTAVNLMWATDRMKKKTIDIFEKFDDKKKILEKILNEALKIQEEDIDTNKKMARIGNQVIKKGDVILTHCNTGALATAGYGTALGVVREAFYSGKDIFVYADETRPRLQGGRLTAWELLEEGIPSKLIPDSVAATLIRDGKIDVILVGADRIASNGDTANKIGTFMLSVIAKVYDIPFYIVAPSTTIDFEIEDGSEIEIEERNGEEITHIMGKMVAPAGVKVFNPAFDVTPSDNITGIITEFEILKPPFKESINNLKKKMTQ